MIQLFHQVGWKNASYSCEPHRQLAPRIAPRLRGATRAAVVCLAICALTVSSSVGLSASDWPVSRGNAEATGATTYQLPSTPVLLWEKDFGGTGFEGTPIVAKQTVYLGDVDGRLFALDLASGATKWEKKMETAFVAPAAFHAEMLFIGDVDGKVHALKAADGSEVWSFQTEAQIDAGANFYGANLLITSEDGVLYCLKQATGELVWKYETGDQLRCGATLSGNRTFLGGCDGKLHIVDVELGKSAHEGASLDGPTGSTPAVQDGVAIVPTHAGDLFALKVADGQQVWKMRDPKLAQEFQNSVAIANNLVVASSHNRRVFATDLQSGVVKWETTLRKRADASPVIAGDKVVVAASDGRLILLDLKTGRELWQFEVKGAFLASPAIADNRLIVASDKGSIYCFGSK